MIDKPAAFLVICSALLLPVVLGDLLRAQESGDFHEFTGKSGQKLVAKVVGVSEDRRQMRIVRQDGQSFDTDIVIFSLDDQQYVKDWMKSGAATASAAAMTGGASSYRLEVSLTRLPGKTDKHRDQVYTMEEKETLFRISVRNLSRETLEGAKVEYAMVWKDSVVIYYDEDDEEWEFSARDLDSPVPPVKKLGEAALEALRFNGDGTLETDAIRIDEVFYDGNELYGKDDLLGLKVRVVGADGTLLHEADSGGAAIAALSWEEILALGDPRVIK